MLNGNIKVLIGCLLYLGRGLEVGPLQPSLVYDLHTHLIGLNGFVNNTCKGLSITRVNRHCISRKKRRRKKEYTYSIRPSVNLPHSPLVAGLRSHASNHAASPQGIRKRFHRTVEGGCHGRRSHRRSIDL